MEVARTQDSGQNIQGTNSGVNRETDGAVQYGLGQGTDSCQDITDKEKFTQLFSFISFALFRIEGTLHTLVA